MCESTNDKSSALYSYQDSKYYSFYYNNQIYGNSNHVTPLNYAIKIWKRIS